VALRSLIVVPALLVAIGGSAPVDARTPGPAGLSVRRTAASPRVVGGTAVANGTYKFQAALLGQTFGSDDWQRQYCGGSLITSFAVLTAAHCVEFVGPGDEFPLDIADLRVVVGRTVLTSDQGQKRRVVDIAIHPRYDPITARFDVAIVYLRTPIVGIDPIDLVTPGTDALERPGRPAIATGWGNTIAQPVGPGEGGVHYPDRLREVTVPIVSHAECATAYGADGNNYIHKTSMLCAGLTGKDTCQGDSGGPLFVPAITGGYIQIGITSWGAGCAATGYPGVYTRLSGKPVGNFVLRMTGGEPVS
jgi:secreted trypsin-like serine protease